MEIITYTLGALVVFLLLLLWAVGRAHDHSEEFLRVELERRSALLHDIALAHVEHGMPDIMHLSHRLPEEIRWHLKVMKAKAQRKAPPKRG